MTGRPGSDEDRRSQGPGAGGAGRIDARTLGEGEGEVGPRVQAVLAVARYHGLEIDPARLRSGATQAPPSAPELVDWVRDAGLWCRAVRLPWRRLLKIDSPAPVVLLLADGGAVVMVGLNRDRNTVFLRDPAGPPGQAPVEVDELRLSGLWDGQCLLIRPDRAANEEDAKFTIGWLARMVLGERKVLRDLAVASVVLSILTIAPMFIVMDIVNQVVVHHTMSTLVVLSTILALTIFYDTILGYGRRLMILIVSTRIDSRLNLHVFSKLLNLPLDFFERNQAGQIAYKLQQIYRVREFLTGRMMGTFLDLFQIVVLLPILFWLDTTLAWVVVAGAVVIAIVVLVFLRPVARLIGKLVLAESRKSSVMVETVHGIRTVKSLTLEPQRATEWDMRVAEASDLRMQAGRLANWPETIATPIERFIERGVLALGAYFALASNTPADVGGLIAFMLLGVRVVSPLVNLAKLMQDLHEVRASIQLVASVLDQPAEVKAGGAGGLRPRLEGSISFDNVTFYYQGTKTPALEKVSFSVKPGTMLGVVGRSGSGKSTIARLLQGINRDYVGFVKFDGNDLREINLRHLRRSLGVVLQDNFLFRGSVRDNIISGRPGLTLEDAVRAARLAGAEEFIERLSAGYETFVEEGSPNLSGGQRQRLAIARALIADPRILILDEATSALDPESEALVNANLQRIAAGRTMVIVSHRLSSLVECDSILVMDQGHAIDNAPHAELLERCAIYRQLWLQQNRHLDKTGVRHGPTPVLAQGD